MTKIEKKSRSPDQVAKRVDRLIKKIKDDFQAYQSKGSDGPVDVVCVAHGHILEAVATRWTGRPLQDGLRLLIDTGGVAILRYSGHHPKEKVTLDPETDVEGTPSYEHHALDEPAIIIGPKF